MSGTAASEPATPAPAGGPAQVRSAPRHAAATARDLVKRFLTAREGSIVVVTVLLTLYFAISLPASSNFVTVANFQNLLPYFAPLAILAAGEVYLMINAEIDLSIAGVYLFTPLMFYEFHNGGIPLLPAVVLALGISCVIGLINGFIVAVLNVNSFIATLGTLFTTSGLTLIVSHAEQLGMPGAAVTVTASGANHTTTFASVFGAGAYSELVWAVLVVIVLQVALTRTRWGLHTVAVGSNRNAAAEAGVKVRSVLIRNFVLCAGCAGLVGILESTRTDSIAVDPGTATQLLLYAIAAAVIGGTLLAGGSGTVIGAMIGALFLGVLEDGLAIKGVNADYLLFYLGLAILLAMAVNVYVGRTRRRSGVG
jgi:simple sugar transport system permease protein